jgi:NADH-quinone oxidoreductase subunit C
MGAPLEPLKDELAGLARSSAISHGTLVLEIDAGALLALVTRLRDGHGFDQLLDVTAVDWLGQAPRFEVVYHLRSTATAARVRIKTRVGEEDPTVDSVRPLYGSAYYMERECHEMYGVVFRGNADLRHILLYEGFVGHPLRKDYPKDRAQPIVPYRD